MLSLLLLLLLLLLLPLLLLEILVPLQQTIAFGSHLAERILKILNDRPLFLDYTPEFLVLRGQVGGHIRRHMRLSCHLG